MNYLIYLIDKHIKYICKRWHETETEMLQLLKSIMRLDIDQSARRKAQEYFGIRDPDYYEYEGHIFFDDAMEENENGEMEPNKFVQILLSVMDQAATSVHECPMKIPPPFKIPTPYGLLLKIYILVLDLDPFLHFLQD